MVELSIKITIDEKGFVFDTGHTFRGITISETAGGWNCILRASDSLGLPVYAMTVAENPSDGLTRLTEQVSKGNGQVLWRMDRYASPGGG